MTEDTRTSRDQELRLDEENPWPGLASFREADAKYFYGRGAEAEQLHRLVRRGLLTVVYGVSGLGKTSLLQAGLFPRVREDSLLPIYVRLDFSKTRAPLPRQVLDAVFEQAQAAGVDVPAPRDGDTLWEFFHRDDTDFWSARNKPLVPLVSFDQFEELFHLGMSDRGLADETAEFVRQLSDLIEGRTPSDVRARVDADRELAEQFDFNRHDYKVLLSLREDFLPQLQSLRKSIPSIVHNNLRLGSMDGHAALSVVTLVPALVEPSVAEQIVRFVAAEDQQQDVPGEAKALEELHIEPSLLSVVCRGLNDKRRAAGAAKITAGLLAGSRKQILADLYEDSVGDVHPALRRMVEDELLTLAGYRDSVDFDNALTHEGITAEEIGLLIDRRLLRVEKRGSTRRLELSHDLLTKVIAESRERRHLEEAAREEYERRRDATRRRMRYGAVISLVLLLGIASFGAWYGISGRRAAVEARETSQLNLSRFLLARGVEECATSKARGLHTLRDALKEAPDTPHGSELKELAAALVGGWGRGWSHAYWHPTGVHEVAFTEDGRGLVSWTRDDGMAWSWDCSTGDHSPTRDWWKDAAVRAVVDRDRRPPSEVGPNGVVQFGDLFDPSSARRVPIVFGVCEPRGKPKLWRTAMDERRRVEFWQVYREYDEAKDSDVTAVAVATSLTHTTPEVLMATGTASGVVRVRYAIPDGAIPEPMMLNRFEHASAITALRFSPDLELIATGSRDGIARVWDCATGSPVTKALVHAGEVTSLRFSADGAHLATAGADGMVYLWPLGDGHEIGEGGAVLHDLTSRAELGLRTHHDDRGGKSFDLVRIDTGEVVATAPEDRAPTLLSASASADGARVLRVHVGGEVDLWDSSANRVLPLTSGGVRPPVRTLAIDHEGGIVHYSTTPESSTVLVDDEGDWRPLRTLTHTDLAAAVLDGDGVLMTVDSSESAVLWHLEDPEHEGELIPTSKGQTVSVVTSQGGRRWFVGTEGETVLLDVTLGSIDNPKEWRKMNVIAAADSGLLVTSSRGRKAMLWELIHEDFEQRTWEPVRFKLPGEVVIAALIDTDDATRLATADSLGAITLMGREGSGKWRVRASVEHGEPLLALGYLEDGALYSAGEQFLKRWENDAEAQRWTLSDPTHVSLAGHGRIATGDDTGTVRVFEIGDELVELTEVRSDTVLPLVTAQAIRADGRRAAVARIDGSLTTWSETSKGWEPTEWPRSSARPEIGREHPDPIMAIALDGPTLVTGTDTGQILVHEPGAPPVQLELEGYPAALALSGDSLMAGDTLGGVTLWRRGDATWREVGQAGLGSMIEHVAFHPTRDVLVAVDLDGRIGLWGVGRIEEQLFPLTHPLRGSTRVTALDFDDDGAIVTCDIAGRRWRWPLPDVFDDHEMLDDYVSYRTGRARGTMEPLAHEDWRSSHARLGARWRPVNVTPAEGESVEGELELVARPRLERAPRRSHWQVEQVNGEATIPVLDLHRKGPATRARWSEGGLIPGETYRWRVAFDHGRAVTCYSEWTTFEVTGESRLEMVQIDLSGVFNRDAVFQEGEAGAGGVPLDGLKMLPVDGQPAGTRGLPRDRRAGIHRLGPYDGPNTLTVESDDRSLVVIPVPAGEYEALRFLVAGGHGSSRVPVLFVYGDESPESTLRMSDRISLLECPDWYHDPGEELDAGVTVVLNGMDVIQDGRHAAHSDPGLFEFVLEAGKDFPAGQELRALGLHFESASFESADTTFALFAITGVRLR